MCYGCKLQIQSDNVFDVYHKDGNLSNNNIANLTIVHVKCHKGINKKKSRDIYSKSWWGFIVIDPYDMRIKYNNAYNTQASIHY